MKEREKFVLGAVVAVGVLAIVAFAVFMSGGGEEIDTPIGEGGDDDPFGEPVLRADLGDGEDGVGIAPGGSGGVIKLPVDGADPEGGAGEGETLAPGDGTISGCVLAEQAGGIAGARVVFSKDRSGDDIFFDFDFEPPGGARRTRAEKAVTTGPDGRFRIDRLPAVEKASLLVTHDNFVTKRIPLGEYDGAEKDVGAIALELGGTISGIVRSADGRGPVEGATVTATKTETTMGGGVFFFGGDSTPGRSVKTTTDEEGFYVLKGVPAGKVRIRARHEEHPPSSYRTVAVSRGGVKPNIDLSLEPGHTIAGTVTDEAGEPLEGIRVSASNDRPNSELDFVTYAGFSQRAKTDGAGAFTIHGLSEGKFTVRASGGIYPARTVQGVETGADDVSLVLKKGGIVHGHVTNRRSASGVPGLDVKVTQGRWGRGFTGTVLTGAEAAARIGPECDPEGAYLVEGAGSEPLTFKIGAKGFADIEVPGITAGTGETKVEDFTLVPEARVAGILLGPDETPLEGGRLLLEEQKEPEAAPGGNAYRVERSIKISGDDGSIDFGGKQWKKRVRSSETGAFSFRGVPAGKYVLTASHENHPDAEPIALTLEEGDAEDDLEIQLAEGGAIAGTVYGQDQLPLPGAKVWAEKVEPGETNGPRIPGFPGDGKERATADIDGAYEFKGLAPGEYKVALREDQVGAVIMSIVIEGQKQQDDRQRVLVRDGETVRLDLHDIPGGEINGFVTEAGKALEGISVQLFPTEGFSFMPVKSASTDEQGGYVLSDVSPGDYRVRLDLPGVPAAVEETVTVNAAGRVEQDFDLPTGCVSGTIVDAATGEPVKGITVRLKKIEEETAGETRTERRAVFVSAIAADGSDGAGEAVSSITLGGGSGTVKTDAEGFFEIRHLAEGDYRLEADGKGYKKGTLEPVAVREGKETRDVNLNLSRGNVIEGKIVDADTGKPVPYCPVRCVKVGQGGEPEGGREMTVSGRDGIFRFKGLIGGEYRIICEGGDYEGEKEIRVRESLEATEVVIEVVPSP